MDLATARKTLAVAALLLFAGALAAGAPEVVQLSPDTYMISKADHGGIFGGGLPKLKADVIKQANEFAARHDVTPTFRSHLELE